MLLFAKSGERMRLSILIVSHGHEQLVARLLASLPGACAGIEHEIVIVDNLGSPDFQTAIGGLTPVLKILSNDRRLGFGANVNRAERASSGDILLVLNPDTEYVSGSLAKASNYLESHPGIGLLAARLIHPDGRDQRNFRAFPTLPVAILRGLGADSWKKTPKFYRARVLLDMPLDVPRQVDWAFGSFMLIRRHNFEAVGGFDESFFMYYEDVDLCLRLRRQGLETWIYPNLVFLHHHQRTSAEQLVGFHRRQHLRSLANYLLRAGYLFRPPY